MKKILIILSIAIVLSIAIYFTYEKDPVSSSGQDSTTDVKQSASNDTAVFENLNIVTEEKIKQKKDEDAKAVVHHETITNTEKEAKNLIAKYNTHLADKAMKVKISNDLLDATKEYKTQVLNKIKKENASL